MNTMTLPDKLSDRNSRVGKYCAAGLGAAVLAGAVTTADAAIVFINFNNQVFTDPTANDGSTYFTSGNAGNFDFNKDGIIDFRLRQRFSSLSKSGSTGIFGLAGFAAPIGGGPNIDVIGKLTANAYPSRLAAGTIIDGTGPFITLTGGTTGQTGYLASSAGFPASQWVSANGPASGFLGIRFTAGGQTFFGWVGLSIAGQDAAVPYAITLSGIAYDDTPNTPIAAGAVPEPAPIALMALGGLGLIAYRRQKAAKAAKVA